MKLKPKKKKKSQKKSVKFGILLQLLEAKMCRLKKIILLEMLRFGPIPQKEL